MVKISTRKMVSGRLTSPTRKVPCLFGISVGRGEASLAELKIGWDWTRARFDHTAVLLGDSLHRITLQVERGLEARVSESESTRQSDVLASQLPEFLGLDLSIIRTSTLAKHPNFPVRLDFFTSAFLRHGDFRAAILADARAYSDRQIRRGRCGVPGEVALKLAGEYLLEEVVIYELLAQEGWLVETYLGDELRVLRRFMEGGLPGLAPALEQRTHLSLRASHLTATA